jgi:hypothetical protein
MHRLFINKGSTTTKIRLVLLIAFIILVNLSATNSVFASGDLQKYTPKTIINSNWGNAPNEFGLREGVEIETFGAHTFTLDKNGNIYIFDIIKGHIKKYDNAGNYINNIGENVIFGSAFTVGSSGDIYVLKNNLIQEYSKSGKLIKEFTILSGIPLTEGYGQEIKLDDLENLYVNNFQIHYQVGRKESGKPSMVPSKNQFISKKNGLKSMLKVNRLIKMKWENKNNAKILLLTEKGDLLKEITMNTQDEFGAVLFKGQDSNDYIYVETERITNDNYVHLEVRKYDESGNLISIFEIPNDYYSTIYKKIEVDEAGIVYQLLTTPDGVQIIKWGQF